MEIEKTRKAKRAPGDHGVGATSSDYRGGTISAAPERAPAVCIDGLTKLFGRTRAVDNLSLSVGNGEIYGFLGPNGAGKTTTIYAMLGLLEPTSGQVRLFGERVTPTALTLRQRVGVVAEEPIAAAQMTAWEFVRFFADLSQVARPHARMEELFRALDLWEARHGLVRDYSRGMRQKLSLIRALVHRPALLILDEPVSGLDPHGIVQVRRLVEDHRRQGGTAFISSHILSEIERSADRVGILDRGCLVVEDTIEGLRSRFRDEAVVHLELVEAPSSRLVQALKELAHVREVAANDSRLVVRADGAQDIRAQIFQTVVVQGAVILQMQTERISLEEAFVTVTSQTVSDLAGQVPA